MSNRGPDDEDDHIDFYVPLTDRQESFKAGVAAAIVVATNATGYHPALPQAAAIDAMLELYRQSETGTATSPTPGDMQEASDKVIHRRAKSTRSVPGMNERLDRARAFFSDLERQAHHALRESRYDDLEASGIVVLARLRGPGQ